MRTPQEEEEGDDEEEEAEEEEKELDVREKCTSSSRASSLSCHTVTLPRCPDTSIDLATTADTANTRRLLPSQDKF